MSTVSLIAALCVLVFLAYQFSRTRAEIIARQLGGPRNLKALPFYYGLLAAIWCALPALLILLLWSAFDEVIIRHVIIQNLAIDGKTLTDSQIGLLVASVQNFSEGQGLAGQTDVSVQAASYQLQHFLRVNELAKSVLVLLAAIVGGWWMWVKTSAKLAARQHIEKLFRWALLLSASIAILVTIGIVLSVLFETLRFFQVVPIGEFIFGSHWSPQVAIRPDQVAGSGSFGAVPLFTGTLMISAIAMLVAVPSGLFSAIYLSEYASPKVRALVKPLLEVLAGIPTVVYGFFAALTVAPAVRHFFSKLGMTVSSESALAAGAVMGIMIIPFISSLTDDVIRAVPRSLREGSLGLGATQSETIKNVIFPAALPGIVGGILLAVSRAIGETMIVVMAAGLAANLTANPLESVTTVTVQIVTLLVGDQQFDSPKTLAAFALGLALFIVTLILNFIALQVVKRYREQYE